MKNCIDKSFNKPMVKKGNSILMSSVSCKSKDLEHCYYEMHLGNQLIFRMAKFSF